MSKIQLTKGKFALIDESTFQEFSEFNWHIANGYAARRLPKAQGKKMLYMHRLILSAPKGKIVDHINGDPLDNRIQNLRLCTHKQNIRNGRSRKGSSIYKGVSRRSDYAAFQAHITVNGKKKSLGCYKDEVEAAQAYDVAATKYFGEFANLNFPIHQTVA